MTKLKDRRSGSTFFVERWEKSWVYSKTMVDVLREPVLILGKDLKVFAANQAFYELFYVTFKDTEGKLIYEIGNGQWDMPDLRKLLENVILKDDTFKGFEVKHVFPLVGQKTLLLNGRRIYTQRSSGLKVCPAIIMLVIEDITGIMALANTLASHTQR